MLTQLAAATAMKGTQRARRGGADWKKKHDINIVETYYYKRSISLNGARTKKS